MQQLTLAEYQALPQRERVAAVRAGRADELLGRPVTVPAPVPAEGPLSYEQWRTLPQKDRAQAIREQRFDLANPYAPSPTEETHDHH